MRFDTTRWIWLAVLAVGMARPAAADDRAPVAAADEAAPPAGDKAASPPATPPTGAPAAPDEAAPPAATPPTGEPITAEPTAEPATAEPTAEPATAEPTAEPTTAPAAAPVAPAAAPVPSPAAPTRGKYRLAILDMPAPRERAQAARVVVAAVREAAAVDARVDLVPDKLVEQAQVVWGGRDVLVLSDEDGIGSGLDGKSAEMTRTQTCAIGHAAGAQRLLLVSDYGMDMGQVSGGTEARLSATLTVINIGSCKVRERAVVEAAGTGASAEEALASGRTALARAAHAELQDLLPLHSEVRAVSAGGGAMAHGARDGVRPGQYFDVHRETAVVGHVYVDDVAADSAEVSLVRGVSRLQPGDRLVERKAMRVFEVAMGASPSVLDRLDADGKIGVAAAMHVMTYRPVGSNLYGLMVERLGATDFTRWRAGVDIGRQVRIVPRRLFAYARVGGGFVWARQGLRETPSYDTFYGGGKLRGFEVTATIGARYLLSDVLVVHLGASMPFPLYNNTWYYEWDSKQPIPADTLIYPRAYRQMPAASLALGWTF